MISDSSYAQVSHQPMYKPMALAALWRNRAAKELRLWQQWLADEKLLSESVAGALTQAQDELTKVRFTIAMVAEVSRGKSELINAMLFAQHGKRIVPSSAGRTTMCPTEFFCDEDVPPFLELLAIDTLTDLTAFSDLYNTPSAWVRFDLQPDDSDALVRNLAQVCDTKNVSHWQARQLGFADDAFISSAHDDKELVEIPKWRYARVNLHHPLLASGLAILDTPGLNVLGHEHELTYAILPTVDAVMYLLSADSGVTRSDQQAWHQYLSHLPSRSKVAVLNKIDVLGDDLRSRLETQTEILQQIERCANALDLDKGHVFAVSAREALTARIAKNDAQLQQSRLPQLEASLTAQLLDKRQAGMRAHASEALKESYLNSARQLKSAMLVAQRQMDELGGFNDTNNPEKSLNTYASATKKRYLLETALTTTIDQTLAVHTKLMLKLVKPEELQTVFAVVEKACQDSSATVIKQQLQIAIVAVRTRVEEVAKESQKTLLTARHALIKVNRLNDTVDAVGSKLAPELKQALLFTEALDELGRLANTCSAQLSSLPLFSSAQRQKAAQTVGAMRDRCLKLAADVSIQCELWVKQASQPIRQGLSLHQALLHRRADTLERMSHANQALNHHLQGLMNEISAREEQMMRMKHRWDQATWAIEGKADEK
jgi:Dynamin family